MASVIKAGNATDGVQVTSDNTGILELKTGTGSGTTAVTIGTDQSVTFAGAVSSSGNQTITGNLTVNGNTTLGDANTDTILMTAAPSIGGAGLGMGFGFRNRIINGAMVIDQRNAGASVTNPAGASYVVDRFVIQGSVASKFTGQQNAGSVTPPAGFINYLGLTSSSAYTPGSSEFYMCQQWVEGLNIADLGWGAAGAQTVTVSFWVRSSLTGTFAGSINNSNYTRSYPFTFSISSANTWTQISVTIPGDTSGTWLTTNGRGIGLHFNMGAGSSMQGTANSWNAGFFTSTSGAVNVVSTNGATFYITGVQLEKGSTATSFDYRPYGTELALCQRYYWKLKQSDTSNQYTFGCGAVASSKDTFFIVNNPVQMRSAPTATQSGTVNVNYNASAYAKTSIGGQYAGTITTRITWNDASLVAGGATWFDFASGAYIDFSSEL